MVYLSYKMRECIMNIQKWLNQNTKSLINKTVAISGSTGGLGRETANYLAMLSASLVLVDRNFNKSAAFADELRAKYPNVKISHVTADMADIESVKRAVDELSQMKIDYLILNAGAYSIPRCTCSTGYDNVFQINFVSPYYMANMLLPGIRDRGGRIVAVGSIAHNYSRIDESDIDFSTRKQASRVYGNAKRYLTYSLLDMSRGDVVIAHPGITFTGITNHYPPLIFALIKHPMKIIFMPAKKAALSIVKGIFQDCPSDSWIGPAVFDVWGNPKVKKLNTAKISERARIIDIAKNIYKSK